MSFFFPRHSFFRSIMFRDSLGWGVLGDRKIQLERIFRVPRPNPYHHYCYFVSIFPLQISDPPSTTIALLNALAGCDGLGGSPKKTLPPTWMQTRLPEADGQLAFQLVRYPSSAGASTKHCCATDVDGHARPQHNVCRSCVGPAPTRTHK